MHGIWTSIVDLWQRVVSTRVAPPTGLVWLTGLVALGVVAYDRAWRRARHLVTIAHEGGHALVAVLTGRRLRGIRVHSDTSGLTLSSGRPTGPGMVFSLLAGYLTPSLLGVGAAALVAAGRITLALWVALVLLLAVLVMVRNGYGILAVLLTVVVVFVVSWFAAAGVQAGFAYLAAWFLLIGGVRPIGEVWRERRAAGRGGSNSDPDQLARLTRVPAPLWVGLFGFVNLGALAFGGSLLLIH